MNCPTCQHDIATHPEGACLDALFCTEVMKWHIEVLPVAKYASYRHWFCDKRLICAELDFKPSTNISHAMEGVEKVKKEMDGFKLEYWPTGNEWICWTGIPTKGLRSETPELAITRALILWKLGKDPK